MLVSPPSRGAWIEIAVDWLTKITLFKSPPSRGAWIEIQVRDDFINLPPSPPSRGAWIEMIRFSSMVTGLWVAPLAGGVD